MQDDGQRAHGARTRRWPSSPTSAPTSSRSTSTGTRSLRAAAASRAASTGPIPPATPGAATTPPSRRSSPRACSPTSSIGGHAPTLGHPRHAAAPGTMPPEREGVPPVRRGRRRCTSRASTSGRSGTSPTSTRGSARSAARARRCRRRSTASSTWPATAASSDAGHGGDTILLGELMPRGGDLAAQGARRSSSCARWPASTATTASTAARPRRSAAAARSGASPPRASPTTPTRRPTARTWPRAATTPRSASCRALRAHARRARAARQAAAAPADLDHRVRLPDQAARPAPGHAARKARRRSWTRASGSPSATRASRATRSTRCATIRHGRARPAALVVLAGRPALPRRPQKPYVYDAFRLPVFVRSLSANRVEVFGGAAHRCRAVPRGSSPRPRGGQLPSARLGAVNCAGYFRRVFRVNGAARRTYRVTIDGLTRVKKPVAR